MKREAKNYKVSILGDHYTLISDEAEVHIMQSAEMVDSLLKDLAQKSGSADVKKLAILAALQLASQLVHEKHTTKQQNTRQEALMNRLDQELSTILPL